MVCASFAAFGVGAKPRVSLLSGLDVGFFKRALLGELLRATMLKAAFVSSFDIVPVGRL